MWEAGQAERKERDERRKEWERENAPEPFDKEVTACEQLVSYLSKFVTPAEAAPTAVEVSERSGFLLMQKPDRRPRTQRTRCRLPKRILTQITEQAQVTQPKVTGQPASQIYNVTRLRAALCRHRRRRRRS